MNVATPLLYVFANILPVAAMSALDWTPVTVLWAYIAQSVAVIGYLLARTLRVLRANGIGPRVGAPVYTVSAGRIAMHCAAGMLLCYFACYIGVFGALLWQVDPLRSVAAWLAFSLSVLSFAIAQRATYRSLRDADRQVRPHLLWLVLPVLLRVVPIHVSLVLLLLRPDLQTMRSASVLVALKIVADIAVDLVDRRIGLRAARAASPSSQRAQ